MSKTEEFKAELYQQIKQQMRDRVRKEKKKINEEFKIKTKYLEKEEKKAILEEIRKHYFVTSREKGFEPVLIKLTPTSFNEQLIFFSDDEILELSQNEPEAKIKRSNLINRLSHQFHFAEVYEHLNKMKSEINVTKEKSIKTKKNLIKIFAPNILRGQEGKKDRFTILTAKQTGLLFKILVDMGVILGEGYLNKSSIYKCVEVLTGFGKNLVEDGFVTKEITANDKNEVRKALKNALNWLEM